MFAPSCLSPLQTTGVLQTAVNKLTKLVKYHPKLHSRLEEMLKEVFFKLEPEVSAANRKQKNEDSCPIYKEERNSTASLHVLHIDSIKSILTPSGMQH